MEGGGLYLTATASLDRFQFSTTEECRRNLFMQRTLLIIIQLCILSGVAAMVCVGSTAKAQYTLSTLATFDGTNGEFPRAALIADASGNLYGTTDGGGANNDGTVFKIANDAGASDFGLDGCQEFDANVRRGGARQVSRSVQSPNSGLPQRDRPEPEAPRRASL